MPTISSVSLKGHGNTPTAKKLHLTKRVKTELSTNRFPDFNPNNKNNIVDNYLVVLGTGFTNFEIKLQVTILTDILDFKIIDFVPVNDTEIHVWFAVFKDIESLPDLPVAGIGAVTVTVTTGGGSARKDGGIDTVEG